jgi:parallel beta-helix repeat protein
MTVNTNVSTASYTGNGSTTSFPVPFYFLVDTDISVLHKTAAGVTTPWVLNSNYTLTGAGVLAGGTITPTVVLPSGDVIYLARDVDLVQQTEYPANSSFPAASHEKALDRLTMIDQQQQTVLDLTLQRSPLGATYDLDGNTLVNSGTAVNPADVPNLTQMTQAIAAAQIDPAMPADDIALKSVLAQAIGASLIGYLSGSVASFLDALGVNVPNFTGATARTLGAAAADEVNSEWFAPDRTGGTDASAALQLALNAAAGRVLVIRPGTYKLGRALQVSSHTTVMAYGCTFYRIGTLDNLIRNKADGVTGAYGANLDIRIFGGTWDSVNGPGTPSGNCTVMGFGHCDRVFIQGATINNENQWHHIEFNGSTRCTVRDCYFNGGYTTGYINCEAIQIDSADGSAQFPWFGPYDGTVCTHIRVLNNDFANVANGIGTHSVTATVNHNNIVIDGNYFFNVYFACIKPYDWSDVKITNNKGESCYSGIVATPQSRDGSDFSVIGNTFFHIGYGAYTGVDGRGIKLTSNGTIKYVNSRIANNNVSDVQGTAAVHGITVDKGIRIAITGNTVDSCNRSGIFAYGGQYVTVAGNTVTNSGLVSSTYEDIRLGTGTLADSTRFNVEGNACATLGSYALQNSLIRNNNVSSAATHTGNSGTNVLDNLVGTTFTAG